MKKDTAEVVEAKIEPRPQAERVEEFNKRLNDLCLELGLAVGAEAYTEAGGIKVRVVVGDTTASTGLAVEGDELTKKEGGGGI